VRLEPAADHPARGPHEDLRLIAVGNLYPVKNHQLSIRAVATLRERGIPVTLDILGRGQEEQSLRQLAAELQIADRVRLRGFCPDVRPHLAGCHAFLSSSLSEGMPLSILEAMATGLPVVASCVGGIAEVLDHGEGGLLFPSGDLPALVQHLERIYGDDAFRLRLGLEARRRVAARFSLEVTVESYLAHYTALAGNGSRPATVATPRS
jgi:glycosyltransferase involved in cell wall biosynthesis